MAQLSFQVFSACSTALFLKFFLTTVIQGKKTFEAGARPPEDGGLTAGQNLPVQSYGLVSDNGDEQLRKAREVDMRWKRIVMNDLETIPIGMIVFLGSIFAGGNETANAVFIIAFTLARISHTFAYAKSLQPHRAICWMIGQSCVLASGLNGVISFGIDA
jgi:glutathione S-transferase